MVGIKGILPNQGRTFPKWILVKNFPMDFVLDFSACFAKGNWKWPSEIREKIHHKLSGRVASCFPLRGPGALWGGNARNMGKN